MISKNLAAPIFDFLFLICLFIFLTGFIPFAPPELYSLFAQKPSLHRMLIAAVSGFGVFLLLWRKDSLAAVSLFKKIRLSEQTYPWILFFFSGSIWTYASWMRHENYKSGFDMAIFTQAVWNTVHGAFLYSSIKGGICLLGDHFSPFLAVFALPYTFWPDGKCLLLFQAFIAASAVFPLFRLAKLKTGSGVWALCVILAFALYLPLRNSVRFEFHPEIAAIPFLMWAYVFLSENKPGASSIMLLFALSTKENLATVTLLFGIYAFFSPHKFYALFWAVFSPLYLYMVTRLWIPAISGQEYFYLSGNFIAWHQEGLTALMKHLASKDTLVYLFKIYMPSGGLAFLDPSFILNLPTLAQNLVSRNETTRSIFFQYTATLTPFVFISTIETLKRFYPRRGVLIFFVFSSVLMAGVSDFYIARSFSSEKIGDAKMLSHYAISETASVRTHEILAPHLSNRKELHIFENNHPQEGGSEKAQNADYVILHRKVLGAHASAAMASLAGKYSLQFEKDGLLVFQKK